MIASLLSIVAVVSLAPAASAYQTWNGYHLIYGVSGQRYWMSDGVVNNYFNATTTGVQKWNDASGVPVSYTRTTTKSISRMDFYRNGVNNTRRDYCAITYHMVDTHDVNDGPNGEPVQNWVWGKVFINRHTFKDASYCGPASRRAPIIAHEQGHVMGLAHAVNDSRLMYWGIVGTSVSDPQLDDRNGINALY